MEKISESYLEIKKSKFIGILYKVDSTNEVDEIISSLWKEHKKARHICYAYRINNQEKNHADKEPGGTTRGLLDIIHMKNMDNTLVVVIRCFGGILLGAGPLTRAYTKSAAELFVK